MNRFRTFLVMALLAGIPLSAQDNPAASEKVVLDLGGGTKMEFVEIKAGSFTMGADYSGERPPHEVKITKSFWMQTTEVSQAQWQSVMGTNPSEFKGPTLPVDSVSWNDCVAFTKKLAEKAQAQLKGRKPSLPTEAEWEYACRAGTKTQWSFGDEDQAAGEYAWHRGNSDDKTHPVGTKKPNPWGLYDMHGNVWEWCSDWYAEEYPPGAATDPQGPEKGETRVQRSGHYDVRPGKVTSTTREKNEPAYTFKTFGMRTVLR